MQSILTDEKLTSPEKRESKYMTSRPAYEETSRSQSSLFDIGRNRAIELTAQMSFAFK